MGSRFCLGTEKFLLRHFRGTSESLGNKELFNAARIPGTGNPAEGLARVISEMDPLLKVVEKRKYRPGLIQQHKGVSCLEEKKNYYHLPRMASL